MCVLALLIPVAPAPASTTFRGTWLCNWKVNGDYLPMAGARVELLTPYVDLDEYDIPGNFRVVQVTHTDQNGDWSFTFPSDADGDDYWVRVLTNGNGVRMHDFLLPWPFFVDSDRNQNDVPFRDYGRLVIGTYRCEVFTGLQRAYDEYVATTGRKPPYGDLDVMSHAITAGTPVTMFTDVWWPADKAVGPEPSNAGLAHGSGAAFGVETAFHEFAHSFRHAFDAPNPSLPRIDLARGHFLLDVVYWNYAQKHHACKKTNSGFAFNEGWASYWAGYYADGRAPTCSGIGATDYSVEGNVTAALHRVQSLCRMTRAQMVDVLRSRSGQLLPTSPIHTFDQFFATAQQRHSQSGSCLKDRIFTTLADARAEQDGRTMSLASRLSRLRGQMGTVTRDTAVELSRARAGLRRAAPCPPTPCAGRLEAAVRLPLAEGALATARLLSRTATTWSPRERRTLQGAPGRALDRLVARRERRFRQGARTIAKRSLTAAIKAASPIARRDRSARSTAMLGLLRRSLRSVSAGKLPLGLLPVPGQGTITRLGALPPDVPPAPAQPPPSTPPDPPPGSPPAPKPDLVVDSITGFGTSDHPYLRVTVRNAGGADAPASKLALHTARSADGATRDEVLDVPALAAGASTAVESFCTLYGLDSATATADSTGAIAESDETNNARSASGGYCRYP